MTEITRRGALAAAAAAPLAACATSPAGAPGDDDLAWMDATETAARIRSRDLSAAEVIDAAVARARALDPQLGFMVATDYDRARAKAAAAPAGPFAGVPFLIKDLHEYKGLPMRNGSRAYADAATDTTQGVLADAYDRAGLIVLGKSSTPEHGYLPTTEPLGAPPTRNPWDPSRSSGGSSGGAAVAVAAGVVPVAHATDGGGSIRIPASNCGLFGLKPSRGRLVTYRDPAPISLSIGHVVSRSVRDSAGLFATSEATGPGAAFPPISLVEAPSTRRLRVGLVLVTGAGAAPDAEVAEAVQSTAALLTELGHTVEPTAWPMDGEQFGRDFLVYWSSGAALDAAAASKRKGRPADERDLEPFSLGMARLVADLPRAEVGAAVARLQATTPAYASWMQRYDVILSPVLRSPPVPLGYVRGDVPFEELSRRLTAYVGYTPLHNVVGAPAMSVPLHWTAGGLPVGSHLAARAGDDRTLLELAYELEAARPWKGRRPRVGA